MNFYIRFIIAFLLLGASASASATFFPPSGCSLSKFKGTYLIGSEANNGGSPALLAGLMYVNGRGEVTLQTTDNDGGGSGSSADYFLTTVQKVGAITQVGTSCVFQIDIDLAVGSGNCASNVKANLFLKPDGDRGLGVTTSPVSQEPPVFNAHIKLERTSLTNTLYPQTATVPVFCGGG